jgi:hypothetical protein
MIILSSSTSTLEASLSGATTSTNLPYVANWVEMATQSFTPASADGVVLTTSTVMVSAPATNYQRQLKYLSIFNADTATSTVTVNYNDNGTLRKICKVILNIGDTLYFIDTQGFFVMDSTGAIKSGSIGTTGATGPAGNTGNTGATGSSPTDNKTFVTLSDQATIAWTYSTGYNTQVTLVGTNRSLSIVGATSGDYGLIKITQGPTGAGNRINFGVNDKFVGGTYSFSTTGTQSDVYAFVYNGTSFFWNYQKNFV